MDEVSLAWWYQDDSHLKITNNIPKKITFSTEDFTLQEIEQLILLIYKKFHLKFCLDGQNRIILYDQPHIYYFLHLIRKHMCSVMDRKIPRIFSEVKIKKNKRTTIYLPSTIHITKPTKEINSSCRYLEILLCKINTDYVQLCLNEIQSLNKNS